MTISPKNNQFTVTHGKRKAGNKYVSYFCVNFLTTAEPLSVCQPLKQSYLQPLEDLAPALVAGCGDEGLEDVAAGGVGRQCQEVGWAQGAQATEEQRTLLELGQRLDQPGAVIADGGQWDLEMGSKSHVVPRCICSYYLWESLVFRGFCGVALRC